MGRLLARCRIGCQVATLGLAGLLGMILVGCIGQWGITRIAQSDALAADAREAANLEARLQIAMLEARREEKNFLLRRDNRSLTLQAAAMTSAASDARGLRARVTNDPEAIAVVAQVTTDMARYAAAFDQVAKQAALVGLHESDGLQGALRDRVHAVESRLGPLGAPAVQVAMLMMRRHEKDFIARLDPGYATRVKAELPGFISALDKAAPPPDLRSAIMRDMAAYQDIFGQYAAAMAEEQKMESALAEVYTAIEPTLARLDDAFIRQAKAARAQGDAIAAWAKRLVLLSTLGMFALVGALAFLIGRGIARPIIGVTKSMTGLIGGDLATPIADDPRRDEIGTMLEAVRAFRDSLVDAGRLRDERAAAQSAAETAKRDALSQMADRIEADSGTAVRQFSERTTTMKATAEEMHRLSARVGNSADGATSAAGLALANAQTVASAAEQLTASIREISSQVHHSTSTVNDAVSASDATGVTIEALNERVGRIGAVAEIISDIAAKTNLLALNATIEAARAGDAGKGFAVVASEVKQLANQTARSTQEINKHIGEVRAATAEAVSAVRRIAGTIGEVNTIAGSIAAAVEEQGAATAEIARGVSETATAVNEMNSRNEDVAREAADAGRLADTVLEGTRAMDDAIGDLRRSLIRTVRTSTDEVDRRIFERHTTAMACQLELAGEGTITAQVADLSEGGARLTSSPSLPSGKRGILRIMGLNTPLPFTVRESNDQSVRLLFASDENTRRALRDFLARDGHVWAA